MATFLLYSHFQKIKLNTLASLLTGNSFAVMILSQDLSNIYIIFLFLGAQHLINMEISVLKRSLKASNVELGLYLDGGDCSSVD